MAEEERLTKRERRERARRERRAAEEERRRRARRNLALGWLGGVVGAVAVGALVWASLTGGAEEIDETVVLQPAAVQEAQQAAGCDFLDVPLLPTADHIQPAAAPPASALYANLRPTHSGPHFPSTHPVGSFTQTIDERSTTHNLEHGAVVVWWDPQRVADGEADQITSWAERLNASGFDQQSGTGVIAAPYEGTMTSGKPVALRAWGAAMDCTSFDETAANGFVATFYGTHGRAPEARFAPYPEDVLRIEAPTPGPEASPGASPAPASPEASPTASPAASPSP